MEHCPVSSDQVTNGLPSDDACYRCTETIANDRFRDGRTSANGENGSDADVSSLSSMDGIDDTHSPAIDSLRRLAEYRRLQSTGSTLDDRLSSISSSCDAEKCNGDLCLDLTNCPRDELKHPKHLYDIQGYSAVSSLGPCQANGTSGLIEQASPEAVLNLEDSDAQEQDRCRLLKTYLSSRQWSCPASILFV